MEILPISTDDHAWEKPDTFTSRVPAKFRDDCPQLVNRDGDDTWVYSGKKMRIVGTGAAAMMPDRGAIKTFDEAPLAVHDAASRLEIMDEDGVAVEVLFPQASGFGGGLFVTGYGSPELGLACVQAYNDYLIEEWTGVSPRFVSQCLVPMWDVNETVKEIERCHEMGHKAVVWTAAPQNFGFPHFNEDYWDPLWTTLQDLKMPCALHIGSGGLNLDLWEGYTKFRRISMVSVGAITSNVMAIGNLLFSGILHRFPGLNFISVESGLGFVPYLLETADHQWEAQHLWDEGMEMRPSEYFTRQVMVNFWYETTGIELRHRIGIENIMWEADFPHPTSTYPHSRKAIESSLAGVPADEQKKMLETNAARVFGLDLDPADFPDSVKYQA